MGGRVSLRVCMHGISLYSSTQYVQYMVMHDVQQVRLRGTLVEIASKLSLLIFLFYFILFLFFPVLSIMLQSVGCLVSRVTSR